MTSCVTIVGEPVLDIYESGNGRCWFITKKVHRHGQQFVSGYVRCLKASTLAEFHHLPEEVLGDMGRLTWRVSEEAWRRCPCIDIEESGKQHQVVQWDGLDTEAQPLDSYSNHCEGAAKDG